MMRDANVIGLTLLLAILTGCGTTGPTVSYNESKNRTTYESSSIDVAQLGTFLSNEGRSLAMRAMASCSGRNCTPEAIRLVFTMQGGGEGQSIQGRSLYIEADGQEYSWEGGEAWLQEEDISSTLGPIVEVELSPSSVRQIAIATSVSGSLGSVSLNLEQAQSELRDFIQTVRNPSAVESS